MSELNERGCRELMCAFILQAVEDVDITTDYSSKSKNNEWETYKRSAIHFMKSPLFEALCRTLNLPHDKIQRRAFQ